MSKIIFTKEKVDMYLGKWHLVKDEYQVCVCHMLKNIGRSSVLRVEDRIVSLLFFKKKICFRLDTIFSDEYTMSMEVTTCPKHKLLIKHYSINISGVYQPILELTHKITTIVLR